jgi:hypothetical protein
MPRPRTTDRQRGDRTVAKANSVPSPTAKTPVMSRNESVTHEASQTNDRTLGAARPGCGAADLPSDPRVKSLRKPP